MTLRAQLLLIAILVLALPISGWLIARQVEESLREGNASALEAAARTLARQLGDLDGFSWPRIDGPGLFVHRPDRAPILDGYADDWAAFTGAQARSPGSPVQVLAAETGQTLHLLFEVDSESQIYSRPGRGDGDQLIIQLQAASGRSAQIELIPMAPGFIETRGRNPQGWPRIQSYWQPGTRGWTVELAVLGSEPISALRWTVVDARDEGGERRQRRLESEGELPLIRRQRDLAETLSDRLPEAARAWVALPSAWVIAHADRSTVASPDSDEAGWIDTLLFERLAGDAIEIAPALASDTLRIETKLTQDEASNSVWTTQADRPGVRLRATSWIIQGGERVGQLILEQDADQLLFDSNRAVLRLMIISLGVFVAVALILLGYATWLSERVRRLRDGLEAAVSEDGQVRQALPASRQGDELGDLGRSVSRLLRRLREHQNYLRTLADKLAHELRTPLAMIRSSLDNLEAVDDPVAIERYRQRAIEGSDRLNRIFQAMSQAARIEESLGQDDFEAVTLNDYLDNYLAACREVYPTRRFRLIQGSPGIRARVVPDLLAQLLDKLIDNAVDFSPEDSIIRLRLRQSGDRVEIDIENDGPALPQHSETLFDSMVSVREGKGRGVHLGLGLSIVRLIAEHHAGTIQASNISGGVRFRLCLPSP
jgi:signal transduction histidine kinase